MKFEEVLGQQHLKNHLMTTADSGRISHAQLFVGKEGRGALPLAIAYSYYVLYGKDTDSYSEFKAFSHPDLHFIYPTIILKDDKKTKSIDFLPDWRSFLKKNPYASLFDWYKKLGHLNKNGEIRTEDAQEIIQKLSLKSFQGGYKILIVWQADQMNISCANKLLKIIEEPPQKTLIILVTENEEDLLPTIKSRCQAIHLSVLNEDVIAKALVSRYGIEEQIAKKIAHRSQGNFGKAIEILHQDNEFPFDQWFVEWVRNAFRAKGNASAIHGLLGWSEEIASKGKETQKRFLSYCTDIFRQALLLNYQTKDLVYLEPDVENFKLEKFAPFVNENNIHGIFSELSDAIYHIERNGNVKLILTDLSIKLTRLIHQR